VRHSQAPKSWIDLQLRRRGLTNARVLAAMERVPRELFVPARERRRAYDDRAIELSHGQTISQPYIVGLICASLGLAGGERVLDVGTGSGYQAAVLAELAGGVVSVERIPALAEQAQRNLEAAGYAALVEVVVADGTLGLPERAPFDAIAVAAAAAKVPAALESQLAPGGRLVIPIGERLVCVERNAAGEWHVRPLAPARFVPLVAGDFPRAGVRA
jgi:protein-L-isoaspartate(D-aspartate) O-methyltransferase